MWDILCKAVLHFFLFIVLYKNLVISRVFSGKSWTQRLAILFSILNFLIPLKKYFPRLRLRLPLILEIKTQILIPLLVFYSQK